MNLLCDSCKLHPVIFGNTPDLNLNVNHVSERGPWRHMYASVNMLVFGSGYGLIPARHKSESEPILTYC